MTALAAQTLPAPAAPPASAAPAASTGAADAPALFDALLLALRGAGPPIAARELPTPPLELPAEPEAPEHAADPIPVAGNAATSPPLASPPSLANLVLGTALGTATGAPPDAQPTARGESRPEPRAEPHAEAQTRPAAFESLRLPALGSHADSHEPFPRELQRDLSPDPRVNRVAAVADPRAPAGDPPPAPHAAQAGMEPSHAAARALENALGQSSPASAPAAAQAERSGDAHALSAARVLPELPARGELEVVRSVRVLAHQGGGQVHIRLDPPELGGVALRVVVSEGAVHVTLLADQPPVADLLGRHSAELRSALDSHGVRLERLEVGTGSADAGSGDAQPRESFERGVSGGQRQVFGTIARAFSPARRLDVTTLGAVDVLV
jgi:flagellar hook-length control protein FliK